MASPTLSREVKPGESRALAMLAIGSSAVLLTLVFWGPLWTGGGFVGGDIYAYYLPQKAYFADCLRAGTLPLWNNLVGHGYPQLAESQSGIFYPLNWALYTWLPLNAAYSAGVVVHYVLAFVFAALYARRIGLTTCGAVLAALVYTYGWFPPRICLEWSITGGAWLPLALWCADSYLQIRYWRYAFLLTATLAIQMLAGHFMLAFVTQLVIVLYVPLRLWLAPQQLPSETIALKRALAVGSAASVLCAFLLAAVQLLPTWELKQHSQRRTVSLEHDPGYGYIPPKYLTQVIAPWMWYSDEALFQQAMTPGGPRTNRVEAHLYFGILPLLSALYGSWRALRAGNRLLIMWLVAGVAAAIYATGSLLPITKHVPGFNFFEGPGRLGVVATLAAGILAGSGFASIDQSIPSATRSLLGSIIPAAARRATPGLFKGLRWALTGAMFVLTVKDLYDVSRLVTYAAIVADPPANHLADSPVLKLFAKSSQPPRVFSAAKNLPSLLGIATVPTYLGLGPEQYFDPQLMLPHPWPFVTSPTPEQLNWFHRAGVTHFLSFERADERAWSARQVWAGADPFLNRALGRPADAKFFLLELEGGRGRLAWLPRQNASNSAEFTNYGVNEVAVDAESQNGGELILTDLYYPGWQALLDGQPVSAELVDGMYRGVEITPGKHVLNWKYRPASVYWGGGISASTGLILLLLAHVRYWHPRVLARVSQKS